MHWRQELSYFITAKSGPLRSLRTLADVRSAWLADEQNITFIQLFLVSDGPNRLS